MSQANEAQPDGRIIYDSSKMPTAIAETNIEMLANTNSDLYILNSLNAMGEFLVDQGEIQAVPDLVTFLEPKFIQSVRADR